MHACNQATPEAIYPFDARGVAKRFRHAAIFGDPTMATAEAGAAFIATVVDSLVETFTNLQGSYQERK